MLGQLIESIKHSFLKSDGKDEKCASLVLHIRIQRSLLLMKF